jgi:hypothetical protein
MYFVYNFLTKMELINAGKAEHIKKTKTLFLGREEVNYWRIFTFRKGLGT